MTDFGYVTHADQLADLDKGRRILSSQITDLPARDAAQQYLKDVYSGKAPPIESAASLDEMTGLAGRQTVPKVTPYSAPEIGNAARGARGIVKGALGKVLPVVGWGLAADVGAHILNPENVDYVPGDLQPNPWVAGPNPLEGANAGLPMRVPSDPGRKLPITPQPNEYGIKPKERAGTPDMYVQQPDEGPRNETVQPLPAEVPKGPSTNELVDKMVSDILAAPWSKVRQAHGLGGVTKATQGPPTFSTGYNPDVMAQIVELRKAQLGLLGHEKQASYAFDQREADRAERARWHDMLEKDFQLKIANQKDEHTRKVMEGLLTQFQATEKHPETGDVIRNPARSIWEMSRANVGLDHPDLRGPIEGIRNQYRNFESRMLAFTNDQRAKQKLAPITTLSAADKARMENKFSESLSMFPKEPPKAPEKAWYNPTRYFGNQ